MSLPKKKLTRRRTRSRRAHLALKQVKLITCPKCKKATKPHISCPFCGYYKGRMVIDIEKKLAKKRSKREQKKAEREKEREETKRTAAEAKTAKTTPTKESKGKEAKKVVV